MSPRMGEDLALALALEGRIDAAEPEQVRLVGLAGRLAALPDPEIDPAFATALEARLLTDGIEAPAPAGRPRLVAVPAIPQTPADEVVRTAEIVQMPRRRFVIRRSIAAVAAAAMLAAFPVAAVANSLPGSPFYGVKRGVENAQIAFFGGPVEDGFSHMELSRRRVDEAAELTALGAQATLVAGTLDDAAEGMRKAGSLVLGNTGDEATLHRFADMAQTVESEIRSVRPSLSVGAEEAAANAIETSRKIREAVAEALASPAAPATPAAVQAPVQAPALTGAPEATQERVPAGASAPDESSADTRDPSTPSGNGGGTQPSDGNGGNGKALTGGEGCATIGSGNGLGDVLAPVTELTCG